MDVIALNNALCEEYHRTHDEQVFRKYVMSELLAPIEDYENALSLIKSQYPILPDYELLFIGAYIAIQFSSGKNEILSILNEVCNSLPKEQQAIVLYLNALQLERDDVKYKQSSQYRDYLYKSCELCNRYVYPYYKLAKISHDGEQQMFYALAKKNIEHSYTVDEIKRLDIEHFLNPSQYIKEFITGTIENVIERSEDRGTAPMSILPIE